MEICFLGVGEACDPIHSNTSILVTTAGNDRILLDCGFLLCHIITSLCVKIRTSLTYCGYLIFMEIISLVFPCCYFAFGRWAEKSH